MAVPQTEVANLVAEVERSGGKHIHLPEFLAIMARKVSQAESPASCVQAFKVGARRPWLLLLSELFH